MATAAAPAASTEMLHRLSFDANVGAISKALEISDVNTVSGASGATPLHAAAVCTKHDATRAISTLLSNGAHPDARTATGATALHVAAAVGNTPATVAIIDNADPADWQLPGEPSGFSVLHFAVGSASVPSVTALLDRGMDAGMASRQGVTGLHVAAHLGLVDMFDYLLPQAPQAISSRMGNGFTPLHAACAPANPAIVMPFMEVLSAVDWLGELHVTPQLMHAIVACLPSPPKPAMNGHDSCVLGPLVVPASTLLQRVIDIKRLKCQRQLHISLPEDSPEEANGSRGRLLNGTESGAVESSGCLQLLMRWVSCFGDQTMADGTALQKQELLAATSLDPALSHEVEPETNSALFALDSLPSEAVPVIVNKLVAAGSDVHATAEGGETALMLAAKSGLLHVVRALRGAGADCKAADAKGRNVLHYAAMSAMPDTDTGAQELDSLIDELTSCGLEVNPRGARTGPLHTATEYGNLVAVQSLLRHGADPNAPNEQRRTPLWGAVDAAHGGVMRRAIVSLLLSAGAVLNVQARDASGVNILTHSITNGDPSASALLLSRARAREQGAEPDIAAWSAAARTLSVTSPLLQELPMQSGACVAALGFAWRRRKAAVVPEPDAADFCDVDAGPRDAHTLLVPSQATSLLKKMAAEKRLGLRDEDGNTLLHHAILNAGLPETSFLLRHNAPLDVANTAGDLPLHVLLRHYGHAPGIEIVAKMLNPGPGLARINKKDSEGVPVICRAAGSGQKLLLNLMLSVGADVGATDKEGRGALHWLCWGSIRHFERLRTVKKPTPLGLRRPSAVHSMQALSRTSLRRHSVGHRASAGPMLGGAAAAAIRGSRRSSDRNESMSMFQQLKLAAAMHVEMVDVVVKAGGDVNCKDTHGNRPLHDASKGAKVDLIQHFVDIGGRLDAVNFDGRTCLHLASMHPSTATVAGLIRAGAPKEAEDPNGRTPLHYACYFSSSEVVMELCRSGANVNHTDKKARTPLHVVVNREHSGEGKYGQTSLPSCRALVTHNAKVHEPDAKLRTPIVLAYMHGHVRVAHYLWNHGADPTQSYGNNTALFVQALRVADLSLVTHLLQNSRTLEVYQKTADGLTFLEYLCNRVATVCFLPFAGCMDELLGRRVPITLAALKTLWAYIDRHARELRWRVLEYDLVPTDATPRRNLAEFINSPGSSPHPSPHPRGPPSPSGPSGLSSHALMVDLEQLNRGAAPAAGGAGGSGPGSGGPASAPGSAPGSGRPPLSAGRAKSPGPFERAVGRAAVPSSVMTLSAGSTVRSSFGANRLPTLSEDSDVWEVAADVRTPSPRRRRGEAAFDVIEERDTADELAVPLSSSGKTDGGDDDGASDADGFQTARSTESDAGPARAGQNGRGARGPGGKAPEGVALPGLSEKTGGKGVRAMDASAVPDILPPIPSGLMSHHVDLTDDSSVELVGAATAASKTSAGGLSKSLGAAAVANVMNRSDFGRKLLAQSAGEAIVQDDVDEDMTSASMVGTASGFRSMPWTVGLGEMLARDSLPFLSRQLQIESVKGALRASSMMLVQWRSNPDAARVALPVSGSTALHLAVQHQMWVAVEEFLTRGADVTCRDANGNTPFDVLVQVCLGADWKPPESAPDSPPLTRQKIAAVVSSTVYKNTPAPRKAHLDNFLAVCSDVTES